MQTLSTTPYILIFRKTLANQARNCKTSGLNIIRKHSHNGRQLQTRNKNKLLNYFKCLGLLAKWLQHDSIIAWPTHHLAWSKEDNSPARGLTPACLYSLAVSSWMRSWSPLYRSWIAFILGCKFCIFNVDSTCHTLSIHLSKTINKNQNSHKKIHNSYWPAQLLQFVVLLMLHTTQCFKLKIYYMAAHQVSGSHTYPLCSQNNCWLKKAF